MRVRSVALLAALSLACPALAAPMECTVSTKQSCSPAGCQPVQPLMRAVVDLDARTYARCDTKGCDTYNATVSVSGVIVTFDLLGRGAFARMTADGREFVEVVSLLTSTLISYGTCR